MRGRLLPSQEELAVMAPQQEALRLQWDESTRQLNRASTGRERVLVLSLREQILDDIARQTDGALPDYVWESTCDPGGRRSSAGA
jgi:urease accessory protein UreE